MFLLPLSRTLSYVHYFQAKNQFDKIGCYDAVSDEMKIKRVNLSQGCFCYL